MTAQERRAAAALRRQAAEKAGEVGGDTAYRAYRSVAPGIGTARRVPMRTDVRAETVQFQGKDHVHTQGFFTRYGIGYPMWDEFGEYEESVARGAGERTIAAKPDVAFLVNHTGMTMARTTNGTLTLEERPEGGWHEAYLNPKRTDVSDLVIALDDKSIDQMSFAFMIPADGGWWSEDFTHFEVRAYDIDRGDVSAVNYGASPYTDIAARTAEVLNDLGHLPMGALRAAEDRLIRRGLSRGPSAPARDRIEVTGPVEPVVIVKGSHSRSVGRLHSELAHTSHRIVDLATRRGIPQVASLLTAKLDWYAVRNADGTPQAEGDLPGWATVYVYDDIGGSFGVDAKTFEEELSEITADNIAVRINSPGGSVFDGITIHSSLLHHPAKVRTYIDGLAASAASVVAMAADPYDPDTDTGGIVVMPGGQMMIHDASMNGAGTAADKEAERVYLDRQSQNIATMYAGRAGGDAQEWRALMLAETWAFAQEAVDLRLADKVFERPTPVVADPVIEERMRRTHDVSRRYRYAGRREAPAPRRITGPIPLFRNAEPSGTDGVAVTRVEFDGFGEGTTTTSLVGGGRRTLTVTNPVTGETVPVDGSGDRQAAPQGRSIADIKRALELDELA